MRKVFWDDPYLQTITTCVAEVSGQRVLFDETIVYSFSGGQESDKGTVNNIPILNSEKIGKCIYYDLPVEHGLRVGDTVVMEIDWERRYALMRLHFAAELILELIKRKLNLQKIGAHIAESKARIDFVYDKNISHIFEEVLADYKIVIDKDLHIIKDFTDVEKQRRYWEIEGFAKVPCGGTHVRSTREVGYVTLKRANIGGGKERVEIRLL